MFHSLTSLLAVHIQEQLIVGVLTFLEQNCLPLFGVLAKLRKVTKVMPVCLSVHLHETTRLPLYVLS